MTAQYSESIINPEDSKEPQQILADIKRHIVTTAGNDFQPPRKDTYYKGLAYTVRDHLMRQWIASQRDFYDQKAKRVYYLSMEYLPGRFMMNYIVNMQMEDNVMEALNGFEFTLEEMEEEEWDAGLGNGGLGRLASCYMDSMATLNIPAYGYGLRYDYGIFHQTIEDGYQVEHCDNWVRHGNPWEVDRKGFLYEVNFYGNTETYTDVLGHIRSRWVNSEKIMAMPCDILVPGYGTDNVNNMRLWQAVSSEDFDLSQFNQADFTGAMEAKVISENISKVLYPSDEKEAGKILRLKQQYFVVAATFQDILRRFKKKNDDWNLLPERVAIQLNDTHPTIAVAELMRLLLDNEGLSWDQAWDISVKTFAYTNHTVLPEALETWPVSLMTTLLPRHMEIIYEINHRFLEELKTRFPERPELLSKLSIIAEGPVRKVRMAHLAIIGSHKVNGVAALHSQILQNDLFKDFNEIFPGRIINVTNGVTPRRWVLQCNPEMSNLICTRIGNAWITDLDQLQQLVPLADDPAFREEWRAVKHIKKERLVHYIKRKINMDISADMMFDVQIKRIHEYKRQLLNALHAVVLYQRIKANPDIDMVPRVKIFAGKAAPAYHMAKLIIKLINSIGDVINNDPQVKDKLKVVFLPNYCISSAEKIIPATDLSEQISTAGMEASGTGNMKFALNGALTIGTLDGANVEMLEEIGEENIFIFGLKTEDVNSMRANGYNPWDYVNQDQELGKVLNLIRSNFFNQNDPGLFDPILNAITDAGDFFMLCADFRAYVDMQENVSNLYRNQDEWTRKSILNTARMGKFSSDRSIKEYAENIWNVKPLQK